ncbi:MAG TPA: hypothetical protein VK979_06280 [Guyparkeria sp.]|nr:hypothetical protein [Guyparkeria sp.]
MTHPVSRLAGLLFATLLLAGCGLSGPDRADLQSVLQQELDPSGEVVVVDSIEQMNAAEQDGIWLVDVEASLRFPQSLAAVVRDMQEDGDLAQNLGRLGLVLRFGQFEAGETQPYQTRLELIKGRSGWMRAAPEGG